MNYKNFIIFCSLLIMTYHLTGCKKKTPEPDVVLTGTWIERSNFEGVARSNAVAFTIKDTAYVGTGFSQSNQRLKDFWKYDPVQDFWTQKADFPGAARSEAMGFGLDSMGYIGTGYDGSIMYKDFYEYNPRKNVWIQKANYGAGTPDSIHATARYGGTAFSINNKGYAGTGFDGNNKKDMWQYDPGLDKWTQIVSMGGEKRVNAVSFVIGNKGYVTSGINNGVYVIDLWEYDPTLGPLGTWTAKAPLAADLTGDGIFDYDIRRSNAVGFSLNGLGYISTGFYGNGSLNSTFAFNPTTNAWTLVNYFGGVPRMDAAAFTVMNRAFVVTGKNVNTRFDDIWEFTATP
jgi:N-acetylneuraminic acid mutarotase